MSRVEAVITDFGGVLTSPLLDSFVAFQESSGISLEELGKAMAALAAQLTSQLGHEVTLTGFGERYFAHLDPNEELIDYMRGLRERGYRLAICTNNVREWEQRWRAKLPVDEIFDVVVDSAFVGTRKPEPRIYQLTLERLAVSADAAVFIDDIEINCAAARELGIRSIWFRSNDQTIAELESVLAA